jgi:hypothetical protein
MNRNFQGVALVLMMAFSGTAFADQWIPYTDGRTGGCWLNKNNQLYGCTPQQSQSSTRDQTASDGRDYCDVEQKPNYAINPTPEQALRSNRAILPARVIAALDVDTVARNLTSNYAFKPTAEQVLGFDRGPSCRGGLTRR